MKKQFYFCVALTVLAVLLSGVLIWASWYFTILCVPTLLLCADTLLKEYWWYKFRGEPNEVNGDSPDTKIGSL